MKKNTKQRLFEVMSRLDSTFKPKLNENNIDNSPFKNDDPTSRGLRNYIKAVDPDGYKKRWDRERPGEVESKPEKPKAMNMLKSDLNEQINPKYTHFAILKNTNKIITGWDFRHIDPDELKLDKMHYFFRDIIDMDFKPKEVLIGTVKKLKKEGIDPFNSNNWHKFEADGWR